MHAERPLRQNFLGSRAGGGQRGDRVAAQLRLLPGFPVNEVEGFQPALRHPDTEPRQGIVPVHDLPLGGDGKVLDRHVGQVNLRHFDLP